MSRVDVVVPCYNYGRFLSQCVHSALEQEGVEVRILIIDDCSSDDSAEVGSLLASEDGRVEYRRHSRNRGHIATYNEGLLEWADAEYVLLISADDVVASGAFARAARVMDEFLAVGMCFGRQMVFNGPLRPAPSLSEAESALEVLAGHAFIDSLCSVGGNPVPTPTAVVRTALQKAVGGYRRELPHTADLDMWLRIAAR